MELSCFLIFLSINCKLIFLSATNRPLVPYSPMLCHAVGGKAMAWQAQLKGESVAWRREYDDTGKTWGDFGRQTPPNKWVTLRALRAFKAALN
jgi:hypothetical protein